MDLTRSQDGGVMKTIISQGQYPFIPTQGDCLSVKYTCCIDSGNQKGRKVEDHIEQEVIIILGQTTVLPPVEACLRSMRPGERCVLVVEPHHAYGDQGTGVIPPNSRLRFDLSLVRIRGVDVTEDRDGSVRKSQSRAPVGRTRVSRGTQVMVRYRHIPAGDADAIADWTSLCYTLGKSGRTDGLSRLVDIAVLSLRRGEVARFSFDDGWPGGARDVPGYAEIELIAYEKYVPTWKMNVDQKLKQSQLLKQKAANLMKENLPDVALPLYHRIISYLEADVGFTAEEEKSLRHSLLLACRLNAALCHLRVGQAASCIEQCSSVLEMSADNEKALFRRAEGHRQIREFKESVKDLERLLASYPHNNAAKRLLADCQEGVVEEKQREKALCETVFDRIHEWGSSEDPVYGSCGDYPIDVWRNDLAAHMMSIPEELEAFGEEMPQLRQRHQSQGSADG